ncbi:hypothetical protein ACFX2C_044229 [Malus domestica]
MKNFEFLEIEDGELLSLTHHHRSDFEQTDSAGGSNHRPPALSPSFSSAPGCYVEASVLSYSSHFSSFPPYVEILSLNFSIIHVAL